MRKVVKYQGWTMVILGALLLTATVSFIVAANLSRMFDSVRIILTIVGVLVFLLSMFYIIHSSFLIKANSNKDTERVRFLIKIACLLQTVMDFPVSLLALCGIFKNKKNLLNSFITWRIVLLILLTIITCLLSLTFLWRVILSLVFCLILVIIQTNYLIIYLNIMPDQEDNSDRLPTEDKPI